MSGSCGGGAIWKCARRVPSVTFSPGLGFCGPQTFWTVLTAMTRQLLALFCSLLTALTFSALAAEEQYEVVEIQAIDRVWSGNYVGFAILTEGKRQYLGYYDANRQMTLAQRTIGQPWVYYKVDSWYGWDSHNSITLTLDSAGHLHVMGNMHAEGLEYFRTSQPYNVRSLKRIESMGNPALEEHVTYPIFLRDKRGDLLVKYRSGFSGSGMDIYNRYDPESKSWTRIHETPLLDGQGQMNAYSVGPALGPDGYFHMIWVWRDTPDAATNHDISYARSGNLVDWEDSNGRPLALPITFATSEIVDPIPARGGLINGGARLGFDSSKRPIISYHKNDEDGFTQVYLARKEGERWVSKKISDWRGFRWSFGGSGSLSVREVRMGAPSLAEEGLIAVPVKRLADSMRLIVREDDFSLVRVEPTVAFPTVLSAVASSPDVILGGGETDGAELIFKVLPGGDSVERGSGDELKYFLTWEAQGPFRGRARDHILPPSTLYLQTLKRSEDQ